MSVSPVRVSPVSMHPERACHTLTGKVFQLDRARVAFGSMTALAEVSLAVQAGERVTVIGPSGAGKSTLLGLLNGTQMPTAGRAQALGVDLATASARELRDVQRRIGTIHQLFDLVGQLRVVHNVNAGRLGTWPFWKAALSLVAPQGVDLVLRALDRVGIQDKAYARTQDLSGGEKQRVAIARVLVQHPVAILADEPIASLDPARGREIMRLLHEISAETGTTLIVCLHDVEIALDVFPRVVGLRDGRVAFDTTPDRLTDRDIDDLYAIERKRESGRA